MKSRNNIYDRLAQIKLPQLPAVLVQLIDICKVEDADIRLVAQTVAKDIAITTKTLRLANSAFLGARTQFKNIDQAVIFLGIDTVRNLAISVSIYDVFGKTPVPEGFAKEQFWYHGLLTALISKAIAQKSGYDDPGAAYLAGLLHDTGKYLLCLHFGKPYQEFMDEQIHQSDVIGAEQDKFGISHCDVGKWLLDSWNMSGELGNAVRDHHNTDAENTEMSILSRIIRLANTLALNSSTTNEQVLKDTSILCISPTALHSIAESQKEVLGDLAQTLGITIKEPESILSWPDEHGQQLLSNKIQLRARLYGFMDNIIQAQNINRVFLALEESLSLLFNCQRSVLLLPSQDNGPLLPHGSFRNQIVNKLKSQKFVYFCHDTATHNTKDEIELTAIKQPTIFGTDIVKKPHVNELFKALDASSVLALPITLSKTRKGLLILGLHEQTEALQEAEEILQLLGSHVGNRLYQEIVKEEYAQSFAKERITAVEDVARSIAHEISNPLGIIQNYIAILVEKDGPDKEMNEELSIINKEIERIANISRQLNDLSTTLEPVEMSRVDINQAIQETVKLFQKSFSPATNISIDFEPPENMPELWMEANPIKQILVNLITNSIDALEGQGAIEILCHHIPGNDAVPLGEIVITVSDNGPGIPPAIANTIFRAGKTTKAEGHAGLGLAIVNKLVKDISGRIYHSSSKQGHTQFTFHFPIRTKPTQ
ncbi:HDOD domain-containing protein [Desulforhopalus sp. IMCC35007]|uniref:HDOD domain-containing protein n=1 Tax=Desulforhopalus sp. IMCC35007 TaxID=2569543 RepID=UPI0010ADFFD3|nr:HDOD domain-containing protein [Desulforhopalus sp. IMCC35007]TKB06051.1 HDOD domain-containing protein [Desulforhopalus sp. IMCC35007]